MAFVVAGITITKALIAQVVIAAATVSYSIHQQRRAQAQAERQSVENAFSSLRPVPSGTVIGECIGYANLRGHAVYHKRTNFGRTAPGQIEGANWRGDPSRLSTNGRDSLGSITEAGTGQTGQYLLMQDAVCLGEIGRVFDVLYNDQSIKSSGGAGGHAVAEVKQPGETSQFVTTIAPNRRNAKFTNIFHLNHILKFEPDAPIFYGQPNTQVFVEGPNRRLINDTTFADEGGTSGNLAEEVLHYKTKSIIGLKYNDEEIDHTSYLKSKNIAGTVVKGPNRNTEVVPEIGRRICTGFLPQRFSFICDDDGSNDYLGRRQGPIYGSSHPLSGQDFKRYQTFGELPSGLDEEQIIDRLLSVAPGAHEFYDFFGKHHLVLPDSVTPESEQSLRTLTEENIMGNKFRTVGSSSTRATSVTVNYLDVFRDFAQETITFPKEGSEAETTAIALNGGIRRNISIDAPNVGTSYHAHTLAVNTFFLSWREKYSFTADFSFLDYSPGDIITINLPERGINNVHARVLGPYKPTEEGLEFVVQKFVKEDFGWYPDSEGTPEINPPPRYTLPDPVNCALNKVEDERNAILTFEIPKAEAIDVYQFDIQIKRAADESDSVWENLATIAAVADDPTADTLSYSYNHVLASNASIIQMRVRSSSERGRKGAWCETAQLNVSRDQPEDQLPPLVRFPYCQYDTVIDMNGEYHLTQGLTWKFLREGGQLTLTSRTANNRDISEYLDDLEEGDLAGLILSQERFIVWKINQIPIFSYRVEGTLPAGVIFDENQRGLSGFPTQTGTFNLVYIVEDQFGTIARKPFSIIIT